MTKVYNEIGKLYDSTRKADPKILDGLIAFLGAKAGERVLDVGCGSGNYTIALQQRGFRMEGLDISEEMLNQSRKKAPGIPWHLGDARALPFSEREFDGVVSVLATHHMPDVGAVFHQIFKVLKRGGNLALFTSTPQLIRNFWLRHYLPGVVTLTADQMTGFERLQGMLEGAGFTNVLCQPFFVDNSLEDFFLQCGKYRPELYLDPVVRAGISSFALYRDAEALKRGLKALEADIRSGAVQDVIRKFDQAESAREGDFLFVKATSPV